jgi:predicted DCC family thiol-disulfide oxidoreductase YuxK
LHSPAANALLRSIGIDPATVPDSVIVIIDDRAYFRSAAILRIAQRLRFPWPLLCAFVIVPPFVRDWLYDIVARNRYRWFGKRETCMMPTPELQTRFLSE